MKNLFTVLLSLACFIAIAQPNYESFSKKETGGSGKFKLTANVPSGLTVGDLLIAVAAYESGVDAKITSPSGWTTIDKKNQSSNIGLHTFYKIATASDVSASGFQFRNSKGNKWSLGISRISGVNESAPIDAYLSSSSSNSTNPVAPSIIPTTDNTLVLAIYTNKKEGKYTGSETARYNAENKNAGISSHFVESFIHVAKNTPTGNRTAIPKEKEVWVTQQIAISGGVSPLNVFRSIVNNGNWNSIASWERKYSDNTWQANDVIPPSDATVTVQANDTIYVNQSLENLTGTTLVELGGSLIVNNGINFRTTGTFTNDGTFTVIDNAAFEGTISGSGNVKMVRNFSTRGWKQICWPVLSGYDVSNLVTSGFELDLDGPHFENYNIFTWDNATTSWQPVTSLGTQLTNTAFNIYAFGIGSSISVTVANNAFNVQSTFSQPYSYDNSKPNRPGNATGWTTTLVDGWNLFVNPYQAYLNSDDVLNDLPTGFSNVIYAWDGEEYQSKILSGLGNLMQIAPNQAFFIRNLASNSGNHSISLSSKDYSNPTSASYFKTGGTLEFVLANTHTEVTTTVAEKEGSKPSYEVNNDAYYLFPEEGHLIFNSVSTDSIPLQINNLDKLKNTTFYLTCRGVENGESLTIRLEDALSYLGIEYIYLEDLYTNKVVNLMEEELNFNHDSRAPAQRFKVHLSNTPIVFNNLAINGQLNTWVLNDELQFPQNIKDLNLPVNIYSINGEYVTSGFTGGSIHLPKRNIYIVKVQGDDSEVYWAKIVY